MSLKCIESFNHPLSDAACLSCWFSMNVLCKHRHPDRLCCLCPLPQHLTLGPAHILADGSSPKGSAKLKWTSAPLSLSNQLVMLYIPDWWHFPDSNTNRNAIPNTGSSIFELNQDPRIPWPKQIIFTGKTVDSGMSGIALKFPHSKRRVSFYISPWLLLGTCSFWKQA